MVLEIKSGNTTLLIASIYFDINRSIDYYIQKMQAILMNANGLGIVFAVDSNARSNLWHYVLTNKRRKTME